MAPLSPQPGHDAPGSTNTLALMDRIRRGLGPAMSRRVGMHHAEVLATMIEMGDDSLADVREIYRALLGSGRGMVMAKLYRVLRVLEEAGVVRKDWIANGGRVRGAYRVLDPEGSAPAAHWTPRPHGHRPDGVLITLADKT